MAGIPEFIIDQVRERTDIVEVISQHIPLKKAGRNYKAPCPFHHEKTPSFTVSPQKQIYHCFGCGAGGNVFNFLMKYERLEFPEAVRDLAKKAGITIPASSLPDKAGQSLSEKLHAINEIAVSFYRDNLLKSPASKESKQYLEKRGMTQEIVNNFKLGYAPKSWNALLGHLKSKGYPETLLEKSGLIIKGKEGRHFDRFRDRVIFPISDAKGKVKGFGSRVLDGSAPKYMNSPETHIYSKGNHLYGLNQSWDEIREKNRAIVVEGYIDFLTPFQSGVKNIVASLGTALTQEQIMLIKRYANHVIILFDADKAGENATVRSLDLLVEQDLKVRVCRLPQGYDPDSFINKFGAERFREFLEKAQDIFDYKINLLFTRHNAGTLEGKAKIASEMLPLISKIKNSILQSGYLKRLAEILSIDAADLKIELRKVKPDYTYQYQPAVSPRPKSESSMAEKILTGLMLEDNVFIHSVKNNLTCEDFKDISIKRVVNTLFEFHDKNMKITPSKLMDHFKDEEPLCLLLSELTVTCENLVDREKSFDDCICWIKQSGLKERLKGLCGEIKTAQEERNDLRIVELVTKYNDLMKGNT